MVTDWKVIHCETPDCDTIIHPDVDTVYMTQFTCPVCGRVETWGITKSKAMRALHQRLVSNENPKPTGS